MTKEEFIAKRFASKLKIAKQELLIAEVEKHHAAQLDELLAAPKREEQRLEGEDEEEHNALLALFAPSLPYKRQDFVCYGADEYYEVKKVNIVYASLYNRWSDVSPAQLTEPPKDFVSVKLECYRIRKSGTLARWHTTLDADNAMLHKADMSDHLCLRRALKQRMRRRLEGGE